MAKIIKNSRDVNDESDPFSITEENFTICPRKLKLICEMVGLLFEKKKSSRYALESELYSPNDAYLKDRDKWMNAEVLDVFDSVREKVGGPLSITSGKRSTKYQKELRRKGYRAASISPHCLGIAIDIRVPEGMEDSDLATLFIQESVQICKVSPRIGYLAYRNSPKESSTFIHFDLAPMVYWRHSGLPGSWGIPGLLF